MSDASDERVKVAKKVVAEQQLGHELLVREIDVNKKI
jgi:hypothetical protein